MKIIQKTLKHLVVKNTFNDKKAFLYFFKVGQSMIQWHSSPMLYLQELQNYWFLGILFHFPVSMGSLWLLVLNLGNGVIVFQKALEYM